MAPVSKRRKLDEQPNEITFDPTARQDYLTGFHKRKVARVQTARDANEKREKEERVKERRLMREQRREDLDKHVAEFNAELRKQNPDLSDLESDAEVVDSGKQEEWEGIDENESVAQEDEYVDEDKYTTVTVEPMGGMSEEDEDQDTRHSTQAAAHGDKGTAGVTKKRPWSKSASDANGVSKPKPKKKKFRYESKAERAMTRKKQKSKSHAAKAKREGK